MRTIGLLGGMSWESSIEYERIIHTEVRERLGGSHSGSTLVLTVDFAEIEALQEAGDWEAAGRLLAAGAHRLETAGADLLVLCTNTMHRVAADIDDATSIPLLHIGDAIGNAVVASGARTVGLLGTLYTMEQPFLRSHLERRFGLEVIVPDRPDRAEVHRVVFEELVQGRIEETSRAGYLEIIDRLASSGAEGVVLGCTEIELLVDDGMTSVPLYPSTRLHALAAVDAALA